MGSEGQVRPGVLVIFSAGEPRHHPVPLGPEGALVLGHEALAALRLPDSLLAPRHAEVRWAGGRFSVRDLGSPAGTSLGEEALDVPVHGLPDGVLRLGETLALLVADLRPHLERGLHAGGLVAGPALQAALDEAERAGRAGGHLVVWAPCPEDVGPVARRFAAGGRLVRHPDPLGPRLGAPPPLPHQALLEAGDGVLVLEPGRGQVLRGQEQLLEALRAGGGSRPGARPPRVLLALAERPGDLAASGRLRTDLLAELGGARLGLPSASTGRQEELPWLLQQWQADPALDAATLAGALRRLRFDEDRFLARELVRRSSEALIGRRGQASVPPHSEHQPRRDLRGRAPAVDGTGPAAAPEAGHPGNRLRRAAATLTREALEEHLARHGDDRAAAARALGLEPLQLARLLEARAVPPPPLPRPEGPPDPRLAPRLAWAAPRFELRADVGAAFPGEPEVTAQLPALEALLARVRPALEVVLDELEQAGRTFRAPDGWSWLGTTLDLGALLRGQGLGRLTGLRLDTEVEPFLGPAEARRVLEAAAAALV